MRNIVQLGLGKVGQELLRQVMRLSEQHQASGLRYCGLADSSGLRLRPLGWRADELKEIAQLKGQGGRLPDPPIAASDDLLSALQAAGIQQAIIVDLTATAATAAPLAACRAAGYDLVFANKAPFALDYATYARLAPTLSRDVAPNGWGRVRHEATVGAGLPVISTLESLLASGDHVISIEASVSGTLGYLCAALDEGLSFSAALRRAHALGYTEPDPRDDLNGLDAARKALILGRRLGLQLEMSDIATYSLIPTGLERVGLDEFWTRLPEADAEYAAQLAAAHTRNGVLRYVASISSATVQVGLREVGADTPLGRLRGSDSIFIWRTARYHDRPLVVQGPGAGPEVTAAGVLADILSLLPPLDKGEQRCYYPNTEQITNP